MNNPIESFTAAQERGITHPAAAISCIAGPGSGKTTVLTRRIRRLVTENVDPRSIAAITFTNAGARNLVERLGPWYVEEQSHPFPLGYAGTLHGFALRMLKRHGAALGYGPRTAIVDAEGSEELLASKARTLGCKAKMKDLIRLKAEGRKKTDRPTVTETAVAAYFDELAEAGLVDFDMILTEFARMLMRVSDLGPVTAIAEDFKYLFVDEVQDSGAVDWQIYNYLPIANKFFVGDPDQSIYAFRGGRPELFMEEMRRSETVFLNENFRSTVSICEAANRLIGRNQHRVPKLTVSASGQPGPEPECMVCMTPGEEVAWVARKVGELLGAGMPASEIAVLSRTNSIAAEFRQGMEAARLPVASQPLPDEPRDMGLARSLVQFMVQPDNDVLALLYVSQREIHRGSTPELARAKAHDCRREANAAGKTLNAAWFNFGGVSVPSDVPRMLKREGLSLEAEMTVAGAIRNLPEWATIEDLALALAGDPEVPVEPSTGVTVTTAHDAKGREWNAVFVVGLEEEVWRCGKEGEKAEEERRLAFVAVTRARFQLFLTHSETRSATWGDRRMSPHTPSRFVAEVMP